MTPRTLLLMLCMILPLAGCGGGGQADSTVVEPPPPVTTVETPYMRLRVEMESTSDWTKITPQNKALIKSVRPLEITGPLLRSGAVAEEMWLVATSADAAAAAPMRLVADIAVDISAASSGIQLLLEKGVTNSTTVRLYAYSDATHYTLIRQWTHDGIVVGQTSNNPLLLTLDAPTMAAQPVLSATAPIIKREALAFYYPWYVPTDWDQADFIDEPLVRYNTDLAADVATEVDRAINSGLTGFVSSWWGPESTTDDRFRVLLNAIGDRDFKTALYYETLRKGVPQSPADITSEMIYALTQYKDHPKYLHWNGKPVMFVWATGRVADSDWATILRDVKAAVGPAIFIGMGCDSANLEIFDGMHDYTVNQATDVAAYEKRCGKKTRNYFLTSTSQTRKLWVATAMPGYNDEAVASRETHLVVPRDNGNYYRATLQAALGSTPDWVVITSWNEWAENTQIEAGLLHGTLYEELTRQYLGPWLAGD